VQSQNGFNFEELSINHAKTMVLLNKRLNIIDELAALCEIGGVLKMFPKILKVELAVQASIFSVIFSGKGKLSFIGICNAEIFLDICLKLAKSKNNFFAEVAGISTGAIIREISQDFFASLTSCMTSLQKDQVTCVKIFKQIEEIGKVMKSYKRGLLELNEINFLIEKLKPKVDSIELPKEEGFFYIK
jgi:hypothetical protein